MSKTELKCYTIHTIVYLSQDRTDIFSSIYKAMIKCIYCLTAKSIILCTSEALILYFIKKWTLFQNGNVSNVINHVKLNY